VTKADSHLEFSFKCSYLEIYMEVLRDLLDANARPRVREDVDRGVFLTQHTAVHCASVAEVMAVVHAGLASRATAETAMNVASSRSHALFVIECQQVHVETLTRKNSRLFCVDLAGSERVARTHAEGDRLQEAKGINKSLSSLANVIDALTNKNATHVPYRDSLLTRVLQDALGGNSKTSMILCASPHADDLEETLSTLRFGARARTIKNNAVVNVEVSPAELRLQLDAANARIAVLESELLTTQSTSQRESNGVGDLFTVTSAAAHDVEQLTKALVGNALLCEHKLNARVGTDHSLKSSCQ
jgi:kinesin family protein 5